MKIVLSEKDFILLLKRYLKDSYTVNYVAFIKDIEEIVRYFDSHRLIDFSEVRRVCISILILFSDCFFFFLIRILLKISLDD